MSDTSSCGEPCTVSGTGTGNLQENQLDFRSETMWQRFVLRPTSLEILLVSFPKTLLSSETCRQPNFSPYQHNLFFPGFIKDNRLMFLSLVASCSYCDFKRNNCFIPHRQIHLKLTYFRDSQNASKLMKFPLNSAF